MRAITGLLLLVIALSLAATRGDERRPLQWGLYQILSHRQDYGAHLARVVDQLGATPDYVMFYRDLPRLVYPAQAVEAIRAGGSVPIVSLELWRWGDHETEYLPGLIAGDHDEALQAWARAAKADGQRILLRFGFEMNGDWFTWGGDPARFVEAWRRAHALFVDAGAANVEWVWAPNVVSTPETADNAMHHYYPGDDVVDWVALDGYNFGDEHDEWHHFEPFAEIFEGALDEFVERYPDKPVMIAETASAPGEPGAKAHWIREAHAWLATRPEVTALIWFNIDKTREGEHDWRLDSDAEVLRAFRETFASSRDEDG